MTTTGPHDVPAQIVARESAAWIWYPPQAQIVDTDEYLLVRWPTWFTRDAAVLRFHPHRPAEVVLDEIKDRARRLGAGNLAFTIRLGASAAYGDLVAGAELIETVDVLARPLDTLPDLEVPTQIEVRWMLDVDTTRDAHQVAIEGFGEGIMPSDERIDRIAREEAEDVAADRGGRVVAYLDDEPAGTLGVTIVGTTARLWAAATRPAYQHRGAFRACLDEVLAFAQSHGATMTLTKGIVTTSAPTFRRAGFTAYGEEKTYLLTL